MTAEPGGTDVVRARLNERYTHSSGTEMSGTQGMVFDLPLHSDPEHKLLMPPIEEFYVIEEMKASKFNKKEGDSYTDYMMVQPALIVLDKTGNVKQSWSWRTMGVEPMDGMTMVPNPDPNNEAKQVPAVTVRPCTADIGPSILEGRPVTMDSSFVRKSS